MTEPSEELGERGGGDPDGRGGGDSPANIAVSGNNNAATGALTHRQKKDVGLV